MICHYITHLANGQIVRSGSTQHETLPDFSVDEGQMLKATECPVNPKEFYWRGGLVAYPPEPEGEWATFDYSTQRWVPYSDIAGATGDARKRRDGLLKSCDWTQAPDAPVNKKAWRAYRQALRDITDQDGFPFKIIWPQEPK